MVHEHSSSYLNVVWTLSKARNNRLSSHKESTYDHIMTHNKKIGSI